MPYVCDLNMPSRKIFGQENNKDNFAQINWLKGKSPEIKPALGAFEY
jgi:hypothetical protein